MSNLNLIRVQAKLDDLFRGRIDLSDVKNPDEIENKSPGCNGSCNELWR